MSIEAVQWLNATGILGDLAEKMAETIGDRIAQAMREKPWTTEAEAPDSDEINGLREEVAHWRVKAEAYGGMVHGCSPVFERIGFPIESHKPDGRVGGIARAAEAIGVEMARLRAAPALTDTAAKVVESAEFAFNNDDEDEEAACKARVRLWDAVRAHLAAKQGGAK